MAYLAEGRGRRFGARINCLTPPSNSPAVTRSSRSRDTRYSFVLAAIEALAGDDHLHDLGLKSSDLAGLAGRTRSNFNYHWPGGMPALIKELFEAQREATLDAASGHAEGYAMVADQLESGDLTSLRAALHSALLRNLRDYDTSRASWEVKGRERLYWLGVALANRATPAGEFDLAAAVRQTNHSAQERFRNVYEEMARLSHRAPLPEDADKGFLRVQRTISALLGGYVMYRRVGHDISQEEITDAVLALFCVLTRPVGGMAIDVDAELQAGASRRMGKQPALPQRQHIQVTRTVEDSYGLAIEKLKEAERDDAPGTIRHASLHGHSGVPVTRQAEHAPEEFRSQLVRMLKRRWHLHRLVSIKDEAHLEVQIELAKTFAGLGAVEVRGAALEDGPRFVPLVIGDRCALLGIDDRFHNITHQAILLDDRDATSVVTAHFDQLWNDYHRTRPILGPQGIDAGGIEQLRRDLSD